MVKSIPGELPFLAKVVPIRFYRYRGFRLFLSPFPESSHQVDSPDSRWLEIPFINIVEQLGAFGHAIQSRYYPESQIRGNYIRVQSTYGLPSTNALDLILFKFLVLVVPVTSSRPAYDNLTHLQILFRTSCALMHACINFKKPRVAFSYANGTHHGITSHAYWP